MAAAAAAASRSAARRERPAAARAKRAASELWVMGEGAARRVLEVGLASSLLGLLPEAVVGAEAPTKAA